MADQVIKVSDHFEAASTLAEHTDGAFFFIFIISAVLLVGITLFMIFCCIRYSRKRNPNPSQIHGDVVLETVWTVIPTILVMMMFWVGWNGYAFSRDVPKDAFEINVYGKQWTWVFEYPNKNGDGFFNYDANCKPPTEEDKESRFVSLYDPKDETKLFKKWVPTLKVPIDTPVKLNLLSDNVIHSFYVPAFRVKGDTMLKPAIEKNHPNYVWFQANKLGVYDVHCAEYCGTGHSQMSTYIEVVTHEEFDKWWGEMSEYYTKVMESNPGFVLYNNNCKSCHTIDGGKGTGPSFKEFFERKRDVVNEKGQLIKDLMADKDYFIESVKKPAAKKVVGFSTPMSVISLTDEQVEQLYEYIKEIK